MPAPLRIRSRASPSRWSRLGLLLGTGLLLSTSVAAQNVPTLRLLEPSDVTEVSLSPSSNRVAALFVNGGQTGVVVLEWRNGALAPLLISRLPDRRSITSYRWLSDDFLFMQYVEFDTNLTMPAIADIPQRSMHLLPRYTYLLKTPWGDAQHALMQSGSSCGSGVASFCLTVYSLPTAHSQQISDPLPLLPAQFLPLSASEIYASGSDVHGVHREYRLDPSHQWQPVPDGTFAAHRDALAHPQAPTPEERATAAGSGVHVGTLVFTQPGHHLVGIVGQAPERAFVALDARLDGLQTLLEKHFPGARVAISGLNDTLTRGLVRVWSTDLPPHHLFFNDDGGLNQITQFSPLVDSSQLGRTHFERSWVDGAPISVTLPPSAVPLQGAVVVPFTVDPRQGEAPLHDYDGEVQAFASGGIAVVRLLAELPDAFPGAAAGAAWRAELDTRLQTVVQHVSGELLHGGPVCLFGTHLGGDLALAAGTLPHVGCTVSVDALVDPAANSQRVELGSPIETNGPYGAGLLVSHAVYGPSTELLHRDLPAAFGTAGGQLAQGVQWAAQLPAHVMLAYHTRSATADAWAHEAEALRSAAAHAGKQVTFFAPDPGKRSGLQEQARLLDAVVKYLQQYYASSAARGS